MWTTHPAVPPVSYRSICVGTSGHLEQTPATAKNIHLSMSEVVDVNVTLPDLQQSSSRDGTGHSDTTHHSTHSNPAPFCFLNLVCQSCFPLILCCDGFTGSNLLKQLINHSEKSMFGSPQCFPFVFSIYHT